MTTIRESFVDAALEADARKVEECIGVVEQNRDYESIRALARAIQGLNLEVARALPSYGKEYEGQGSKFTTLGNRAISIAALVPEKITRTDSKGDRSAHALISRSSKEIAESVSSICT